MQFDSYYEPTTVKECLQMLDECGPDGRLLAGGTDLVFQLKKRTLKVKAVISLQAVADLARVDRTGEGIHVGAMARLADLSARRRWSVLGAWLGKALATSRASRSATPPPSAAIAATPRPAPIRRRR